LTDLSLVKRSGSRGLARYFSFQGLPLESISSTVTTGHEVTVGYI